MPMSHTKKLATNTATHMVGRAIGTIFGVLTIALMTRALGAEGYGHFTLAFTFLAMAGALADFGFTLTTTQMISEDGADAPRIVSNALTMRLISGVFFFGLAAIAGAFMPYDPIVKLTIAVGAFSFFFMTLSQMFIGVYQKHLAMWRPALAEALSRGVIFLLIAVLAAVQPSAPHMMGAFAVGNALMAFINIALSQQYVRLHLGLDVAIMRRFLSRSWPIAITIFLNLLYLKGDIIFMSFWRTSEEIGLYGAAYKALDVISLVPTMFMGLSLPLLVAAWSSKTRETFHAHVQTAFDFFSVLALPILGGTLLVAQPLMALVAGEEFRRAGVYLVILMLANTFVFYGILFSHVIVAINKQRAIIPAFLATAAVAIVLYLLTIPEHGAIGAAWTTVISEAMIAALTAIMVMRVAHFRPRWRSFNVALLSTIAMTSLGFLYISSLATVSAAQTVAVVVGSAVFYPLSVLALGGVRLATIRDIVKRA